MHDVSVNLFFYDVYFLLSKITMHPLLQNMPIERSALFFSSGKCVRVVPRWGGCPEVVKWCVRKR